MHNSVHRFVKEAKDKYPDFFKGKTVLEVGSMNLNGSIRMYFDTKHYLGIDLGEGPDVDMVCSITDYKAPRQYRVVISTEMLEHCKEWRQALLQMYENLKPGGLFIMTCAGINRQKHGVPENHPEDSRFTLDWYRNISVEDFESVLPRELFTEYDLRSVEGDTDTQFMGIKKN